MFNNRKGSQIEVDMSTPGKPDTTIISSGSNFDGTLNASGIVRVDGVFSGIMNVDGNVIIGEGGYIKGNIKAERVTIAGKVEGNIYTEEALELTTNGKLYGDIEVKSVTIADGAIFQGKCVMIQQGKASYENADSSVAIP